MYVAIIGSGPSGMFAARVLAAGGVQVALFNRDIKPGGLAEYGIYPDKHRMKDALRCQFRQILDSPEVTYFGNVTVGKGGDLTLDDLRRVGFNSVLVTVGAQANKLLGISGEDLPGVYHSKDLVYHYNSLPPFGSLSPRIGMKVAIVGVGNVMMDITRWLIDEKRVSEVIALARRGPAEVKFDRKELEYVVANLDFPALKAELERVAPVMKSVGQNPEESEKLYMTAMEKAMAHTSSTRFSLRFLSSPAQVLGDTDHGVCGLKVEDTILVQNGGDIKARGTGKFTTLDVDTVIFAIGDRVDSGLGLPVQDSQYACCPEPNYPVEDISYEISDPADGHSMRGFFVAGWARQPSKGLVGTARRDGSNAAAAILKYLSTQKAVESNPIETVQKMLDSAKKTVITKKDIRILQEAEQQKAQSLGLEDYKFCTNEEMLNSIGK